MLLEVKKVNKIYHTGKVDFQALYDIDLKVEAGEFTALAGPSGSGKTTLLNLIGCLDSAESGEILLEGQDIVSGKDANALAALRREYFGFIFQTYNLMPVLTVYENVELPLKLLKKSEDEVNERVMKILKDVGLEGLENRMPLELSGGQQQRVSIARALVKSPKMVLADEPTANLDSKTGEGIVDLMKEMNQKEGVTFVFSTHDRLIMEHARRIVRLRDGRIIEEG